MHEASTGKRQLYSVNPRFLFAFYEGRVFVPQFRIHDGPCSRFRVDPSFFWYWKCSENRDCFDRRGCCQFSYDVILLDFRFHGNVLEQHSFQVEVNSRPVDLQYAILNHACPAFDMPTRLCRLDRFDSEEAFIATIPLACAMFPGIHATRQDETIVLWRTHCRSLTRYRTLHRYDATQQLRDLVVLGRVYDAYEAIGLETSRPLVDVVRGLALRDKASPGPHPM